MFSKIFSGAILGINSQMVEVETEVSYGLRSFEIVGLGDRAVQESKERVGPAIKNSGFRAPHTQSQRIVVSLAPADLKKEGSFFDLAIALGYLRASRQIRINPEKTIFIGELSLEGKLKPIKGAISFALCAKENGFSQIVLPKENGKEACLVDDIKVITANSLKEVINHFSGQNLIFPEKPLSLNNGISQKTSDETELHWISGQEYVKRALEIVAAGGHNLAMLGAPGTGKTLLAKAIPSLLPSLNKNEVLELTKIYSIAGLCEPETPFLTKRPFRAPHHSASRISLLGGGNPPRIGEITLSHRGVLFLDEFPEFTRDVLEALRQPLEDGRINVLRANYSLTLPASFTLVAASNPCPCGYFNDPEIPCQCTPSQIAKYRRKLSGPLMDRIDLTIEVPRVSYKKMLSQDLEGKTEEIKDRIRTARAIQEQRFANEKGVFLNSRMNVPLVKKYCQIDAKSHQFLAKYVDSGKLSARGLHKVLKTSRTIADLEQKPAISFDNVAEALMYRIRND